MHNIRPLSWDSEFFNRTIGQIHLSTIEAVGSFQTDFNSSPFELVYVTTETEALAHEAAALWGSNPIEYKRTYSLNEVPPQLSTANYTIVEIKESSSRLVELTYQSGEESRFFKDDKIDIVDFQKLYRTWIEKSLSGEIANHVYGIMMANQLVGFVTLAYKTDFAQVGLIAVHNDYRGKGIAKALMNHCVLQTQVVGKMPLKVVTQAHNVSACRLYESLGFKELTSIPLFHIWK